MVQNDDDLNSIKFSLGEELKGRKIGLCLTGSPASIKSPEIARKLIRHGAEIITIMSIETQKFIKPQIMNWATQNIVLTSLDGEMEHIRLVAGSEKLDLLLIAPCTSNTICKISSGISDSIVTLFSSSALGVGIPIIIAPSMHESMWNNPILKSHLKKLEKLGVCILQPNIMEGKAKIAPTEMIVESVIQCISEKDLKNQEVLITAGPTVEYIDPVRVITNQGSGKMGFALAREASRRGAKVTLVSGSTSLIYPPNIEFHSINTTKQLLETVKSILKAHKYTLFISAGSPEDFYPLNPSKIKISSRNGSLSLHLKASEKVINIVKKIQPDIFLISFKAVWKLSKEEAIKSGKELLSESKSDIVAINDLSLKGAGFKSDLNQISLLTKNGFITEISLTHKQKIAHKILNYFLTISKNMN